MVGLCQGGRVVAPKEVTGAPLPSRELALCVLVAVCISQEQ